MNDAPLTQALFAILTNLVEERTGMHHGERDLELFSAKVRSSALEAGFESVLDYYYYLRYDDPDEREFQALTERLVVNETYFLREVAPLQVLCDQLLAPAIAANRRPRIWCAACSTGEEPLTLAMMLAERGLLPRVEIVASDISPRVLARATEGVYGARSFRGYAGDPPQRWFEPRGERTAIRRELVQAIDWRRVNLVDGKAVAAQGLFDVILCRNVFIYFSDETVCRVVAELASALRDGGRLLVGASESLLRFGTMLACEERGGSFFYARAGR